MSAAPPEPLDPDRALSADEDALHDAATSPADETALHADAALLQVLAHPLRLRVLRQLRQGPCCVSVLVEEADSPQPSVSRHLAVLREAGLVEVEVDGRRRCYHLRRPELVDALLALLDAHRTAVLTPAAALTAAPGATP